MLGDYPGRVHNIYIGFVNEALIQAALDKLIQGKTSIIIAHCLLTVQNADQIIVLEDGKVVQNATHQTLIKETGV